MASKKDAPPRPKTRLYLITPPQIDPISFADTLRAALAGGDVACLQLRLKQADGSTASQDHIAAAIDTLMPIAHDANIAFILNDDPAMAQKYGCLMHGVGLCDEWPLVAYPDKAVAGAFDYELKPGMTLCVEALVGEVGGDFSIKLEDQVIITEDGYENLTTYPLDGALMGH